MTLAGYKHRAREKELAQELARRIESARALERALEARKAVRPKLRKPLPTTTKE